MADSKPLFPKAKKGKKGKNRHLLLYGGLAAAAAVGIFFYTQNKKKPGTQTATPTTQATGGAYSTSPAVGTLASQVPQFVNQTYVNPTPPQVTQTTNITNKPYPAPRPVHITINQEDEDHRRKRGGVPPPPGWKGPHPGHPPWHSHPMVPAPLPGKVHR